MQSRLKNIAKSQIYTFENYNSRVDKNKLEICEIIKESIKSVYLFIGLRVARTKHLI